MGVRGFRLVLIWSVRGVIPLLPLACLAQSGTSQPTFQMTTGVEMLKLSQPDAMQTAALNVSLRNSAGTPLEQVALVTLSASTGNLLLQANAKSGRTEFGHLRSGAYTLQVFVPGYQAFQETLQLKGGTISNLTIPLLPGSGFGPAGTSPLSGLLVLSPKNQKLVAKIQEAFRDHQLEDAREWLEKLYRAAPGNPEVNYLYGLYESVVDDWSKAQSYWRMAVQIDPKHFAALIQLGQAALHEQKPADAVTYLNLAIEAEPTVWRPHALLAQALLDLGHNDQALQEANRAIDLGHSQAASVEPLLARALAAQGDTKRALETLQSYLQLQPGDASAQALLESIRSTPSGKPAADLAESISTEPVDMAPLLFSAWRPPDVDEAVPPVEPAVACSLDGILHQASGRLIELLGNVERLTAAEWVKNERVDKAGLTTELEMRRFDYSVSIRQPRPDFIAVDEYRDAVEGPQDFPDGIATFGLPAMVLAFHPANASNFIFTCEGLAHLATGPSWQIRFQQRPDRVPTLRGYKTASQFVPIALRGRAWISADSYQIVRMETDLARPHPEIRLIAEHTVIEYGAVHFQARDVGMWLPKTAEVYFDLMGKRIHRSHSYSNYMLFSVDTEHRILAPKSQASVEEASDPPVVRAKP